MSFAPEDLTVEDRIEMAEADLDLALDRIEGVREVLHAARNHEMAELYPPLWERLGGLIVEADTALTELQTLSNLPLDDRVEAADATDNLMEEVTKR